MSVNLYASSFDEVLIDIRTRLLEIDPFSKNPNAVRIIADDPAAVPPLTGDMDLLVIGGGGTVNAAVADGSGRAQTPMRRVVEVAVRTRNASDPMDSDQIWVTRHLPLEHAVFDKLQMWFPESPAVTDREPMRLIGVSKPTRARKGSLTGSGQWGVSVISFEVVHVLRLEQTQQ